MALSGTGIRIPCSLDPKVIKQVRIVPKVNHIQAEIVYAVPVPTAMPFNGRCAALDLGLNNLAAVVSTVASPLILNGRPLKSVNQFCNKRSAELRSRRPNTYEEVEIGDRGYSWSTSLPGRRPGKGGFGGKGTTGSRTSCIRLRASWSTIFIPTTTAP